MTALEGSIVDAAGAPCRARVAALDAGGAVLAVADSDGAGRWRLAPVDVADRLVASSTAAGIAAVAQPLARGTALRLPETFACSFAVDGSPTVDGASAASLWIDPAALPGLAADDLMALRTGADGAFALHLGDFAVSAEGATLALQAGDYRVGGGRVGLRPEAIGGAASARIGALFDVDAERPLVGDEGVFAVTVAAPSRFVVRFERVPP